ncbi:hypothetical protein L1049_002665 [Liquidambar formosana]|uniref:Uncharacterized protein n=1 Tax=Liquidambar formosana TaxID=63359 RepID=A0AAP0R8D2_LIQFO
MSSVNTSSPAARVETVGFFRSERMGFVVPPAMSFMLGKERSRRAHPRSTLVCPCPSPSSSKAKSSSFNAAGCRQPTSVVVYRRQNGNPNPWLWKPKPTQTHCKMETETLSDEGSGAGMVIPGGFMGKDSEGSLAARDLAVDLAVWLQCDSFPERNQLAYVGRIDEEGAFCGTVRGRGRGGASGRSALDKGSDMQRLGAQLMPVGVHVVGSAIENVLQQVEGAKAMPMWVPQGPKSQAICQLSQRQKG